MKPETGTNIGNAIRELAPNTTWKLHGNGNLSDLEWMDDPSLRPTDEAILQKEKELDEDPNYPPRYDTYFAGLNS